MSSSSSSSSWQSPLARWSTGAQNKGQNGNSSLIRDNDTDENEHDVVVEIATAHPSSGVTQYTALPTPTTTTVVEMTSPAHHHDHTDASTDPQSPHPPPHDHQFNNPPFHPPPWLTHCLPSCLRLYDDSPPEATGIALDLWARGCILMSSLFVGPALLDLARYNAAAIHNNDDDASFTVNDDHDDTTNDNQDDCRVYGFKATSLLANIAIGAGLLGSLTMPFLGAVMDHTPHRRRIAAVSAIVLAIIKAVEACIGPSTWFLVAHLQVLSSLLYNTHATAAYAYTSELTTSTNNNSHAGYHLSDHEEQVFPDKQEEEHDMIKPQNSHPHEHTGSHTNHQQQQQQHDDDPTNKQEQSSTTRQAQYNAHFNIILYVSMLLFLIFVLLLTALLVPFWIVEDTLDNNNEKETSNSSMFSSSSSSSLTQLSPDAQANVYTARISQTLTGIVTIPCFILAWKFFFGPRPAAPLTIPSTLLEEEDACSPPDHDETTTSSATTTPPPQQHATTYSLWTIGFVKVAHTVRTILRHNRPLAWALLSILLAEAAMSALATIATTYATHVLDMTGSEIGLLFFIVLVAGIPGSHYGGSVWTVSWSPRNSVVAAHMTFVGITTTSVFVLNGPSDKYGCYLFGALWGFVIGWLSPADTSLFMSFLSSQSSRAEWMGMFLLATSALAWLPPLVFTLLNEAGWHMKWGLASLNLYFVGAAMCLLLPKDESSSRQHRHLRSDSVL